MKRTELVGLREPPRVVFNKARGSSFLQQLRIQHGPLDLLGRFFLKAEQAARSRGIQLAFATLEDLVDVNRKHLQSWQPLLPMFEPQRGFGDAPSAFCIVGRDADGEIVATQAARIYSLGAGTLYDEATSLRLFYPALEPENTVGKACRISAPSAHMIRGKIVYSGGGWYHPNYRGLQLSAILPRISRAYAHTRWNTNTTVSFINTRLIEKGVAHRYGYTKIDNGVELTGMVASGFKAGLAWMNTAEMLADLETFNLGASSQVQALGKLRSG